MSKKATKLSKNNFQFLMDCIAEKTEEGADKKSGLLYFIKDSLIAERVVTKYAPTSLEYFKAFFCSTVLELYSDINGLNFKEFQKYFDDVGKPYAIETENMDRYLDKQENMRYIQKVFPGTIHCENWENVFPILLIERLQQVSHQCLKEYFLADKEILGANRKFPYTIDNKRTRDIDEIKKRLLRRVACAACLYEIFVYKFLEPEGPEEVFSAMEVLRENAAQIVQFAKDFQTQAEALKGKKKDDEEVASVIEAMQKLTEKLTVFQKEMTSTTDRAMYSITKAYYYFTHIRYVMALCAIISIVEYINVNREENAIPKKWKNFDAVEKLQKVISNGECDFLLFDEDTEIKLNKNNCDVYKKMTEAIEQEKLIQELCSSEKEIQEEALVLLQRYFIGILTNAGEEDKDFLSAVTLIFRKCLN